MTSNRRLSILRKAASQGGCPVSWRGLTHHEASADLGWALRRDVVLSPEPNGMARQIVRYRITDEGQRYLDVMEHGEGAA